MKVLACIDGRLTGNATAGGDVSVTIQVASDQSANSAGADFVVDFSLSEVAVMAAFIAKVKAVCQQQGWGTPQDSEIRLFGPIWKLWQVCGTIS